MGLALVILCAGLIGAVAAAVLYQYIGSRIDRRDYPPPGRLVDVGGRRMHLMESGSGSPVVILESGIAASCLNWTNIHAEVARFTRVCSYDRASLGWSDSAATPRVTSRLADELHELLNAAGVSGPYVLAGHSYGGMLVRAYATMYPDEVAGLVLVDPLPASEWMRPSEEQARILRWGARLARRGALLARLGIVRVSLRILSAGGRTIPKLVARLSSGRAESTLSRLVGEVQKMPRETWPMIQAHWRQPKGFLGMSEYFKSLPQSAAEAAALMDPPPDIPVVVLSASNSTAAQLAERAAMARHSSRGAHIVAEKSGHWIHLDEPELVLDAIREMVAHAKC
ncbi:MAG TPA: alpha/beta hydrolase [Bryobacteraceae bacterium]